MVMQPRSARGWRSERILPNGYPQKTDWERNTSHFLSWRAVASNKKERKKKMQVFSASDITRRKGSLKWFPPPPKKKRLTKVSASCIWFDISHYLLTEVYWIWDHITWYSRSICDVLMMASSHVQVLMHYQITHLHTGFILSNDAWRYSIK